MVRTSLAVATLVLLASGTMMTGAASSRPTGSELQDEVPMDGLLPRHETIAGRLTFNPQSEPGTSGWELRRQGKAITLDVSAVQARAERLRGQRVRLEGSFVFAGLGRTFVVTRMRRA